MRPTLLITMLSIFLLSTTSTIAKSKILLSYRIINIIKGFGNQGVNDPNIIFDKTTKHQIEMAKDSRKSEDQDFYKGHWTYLMSLNMDELNEIHTICSKPVVSKYFLSSSAVSKDVKLSKKRKALNIKLNEVIKYTKTLQNYAYAKLEKSAKNKPNAMKMLPMMKKMQKSKRMSQIYFQVYSKTIKHLSDSDISKLIVILNGKTMQRFINFKNRLVVEGKQ